MARPKKLENMSTAELAAIEARIARIKIQKQNAARAAVREKMMAIAKEHGFDIRDLIDGRKSKRQGGGEVSRSSRKHLDRSGSDAALAGSSDEGRKSEEGRLPRRLALRHCHWRGVRNTDGLNLAAFEWAVQVHR